MSVKYHDQTVAGTPSGNTIIATTNPSVWNGGSHEITAETYTEMFSNLAAGLYLIFVNASTDLNNDANTTPVVITKGQNAATDIVASLGMSGGTAVVQLATTSTIYMYCNISKSSQMFYQMTTFAVKIG